MNVWLAHYQFSLLFFFIWYSCLLVVGSDDGVCPRYQDQPYSGFRSVGCRSSKVKKKYNVLSIIFAEILKFTVFPFWDKNNFLPTKWMWCGCYLIFPRLGRYAVESYLEQILSHGFFHADPVSPLMFSCFIQQIVVHRLILF